MTIDNLNPMIALASDPALFDFSEKVGKNYDLQIDQIGEMDSIIRNLLLGTIKPAEFNDLLIQKLEISNALADKLVQYINVELPPIIKSYIYKQTEQPVPQRNTVTVDPSPNFQKNISSPHADLEQAGNFKIETEASFDGNYSLKSPPKKASFITQQNIEANQNRIANLAKLNPTEKNPEPQVPKSEPVEPIPSPVMPETDPVVPKPKPIPQPEVIANKPEAVTPKSEAPAPQPVVDTASKMQAFDPKNFYNFSNTEEQPAEVKKEIEEKVDNIEAKTEEQRDNEKEVAKEETPVASTQIFQKSASAIHFAKELKNKHTKISASQAYQPKIKEVPAEISVENKQAEKIANDEQTETERANTALIDELIAHPKVVVSENKEVEVEKPVEATETITTKPVLPEMAPKVPEKINAPEPIISEPVATELIRALETKAVVPANLPVEPEIKPAVEEKIEEKIEEKTTTIPVKIVAEPTPTAPTISDDEIRNDIRSKVSEFNPTTKWPETSIPTIETVVQPEQKSDTGVINLIPTKNATVSNTPSPIKPRSFDPYREQVQ